MTQRDPATLYTFLGLFADALSNIADRLDRIDNRLYNLGVGNSYSERKDTDVKHKSAGLGHTALMLLRDAQERCEAYHKYRYDGGPYVTSPTAQDYVMAEVYLHILALGDTIDAVQQENVQLRDMLEDSARNVKE